MRARARALLGTVLLVLSIVAGACVGRTTQRPVLDLYHTLLLPAGPATQASSSGIEIAAGDLDASSVVLIDAARHGENGSGVVDRATLARIVSKASQLGAWAIGLDVFLDVPSDPTSDGALERAIREARRVVLATWYSDTTSKQSIPLMADAACTLGITNLPVDEDGYVRTVLHHFDERQFRTRESMSLALVSLIVNYPQTKPAPLEVHPDALRLAGSGLSLWIPIDALGHSLIQYEGTGGTLPVIGWDRFLTLDRRRLDLSAKALLIGNARLDTRDAYFTPFHRSRRGRIAGLEILGQDVAGILSGLHRRIAPDGWSTVAIIVAGLFGLTLAGTLRVRWSVPIAGVLGAALAVASYMVFAGQGLFVSPAGPLAAGFTGLASMLVARALEPALLDLGRVQAARVAGASVGIALLEPALEAAIDAGERLLDAGQVESAIAHLQGLLASHEPACPDRLRLALARALLAREDVDLALEHAARIDGSSLSLPEIYDLAVALQDNGASQEATKLYTLIKARDLDFRDVSARLALAAAQSTQVPEALRRQLLGRYRDLTQVGSGGMASVYRAWDRKEKRHVALKVPDAELVANPGARARFIREGEVLARLKHPHVVRLFEVSQDAIPFYTMELIEGKSLADHLAAEGSFDVPQAIALLAPIVSALAVIHAHGIIHRDVKPANVLLRNQGVPLLADFGLAFDQGSTRLTQSSAVLGTPTFMAPEQFQGGIPTPAVDVYAFAVMLFVCLAGQPPFPYSASLRKVTEAAPSILTVKPGVHPDLACLLAECLERDPAARPPDGRVLFDRLLAFVRGQDGPAFQVIRESVEALVATLDNASTKGEAPAAGA